MLIWSHAIGGLLVQIPHIIVLAPDTIRDKFLALLFLNDCFVVLKVHQQSTRNLLIHEALIEGTGAIGVRGIDWKHDKLRDKIKKISFETDALSDDEQVESFLKKDPESFYILYSDISKVELKKFGRLDRLWADSANYRAIGKIRFWVGQDLIPYDIQDIHSFDDCKKLLEKYLANKLVGC